jgi:hypothetical protein
MNLSKADADLYFELMRLLQLYTNNRLAKYSGVVSLDDYFQLSQKQKFALRNALFSRPELITEYATKNPDGLSKEKTDIIHTWRHFIQGQFYIERYLKNYAIFIKDRDVYAVLALYDGFDKMAHKSHLPLYTETILLPFKGQIIYDGLMQTYNMSFGRGIKSSLNEIYQKAKQNNRIITCLDNSKNVLAVQSPLYTKDWTPEIEEIEARVKKLKGGTNQPVINGPVFSLLKAVVELARLSVVEGQSRDVLIKQYNKISRALNKVSQIIDRMD